MASPEVFLGKLARLLLAVTLVTCIILGFGRVLAHIGAAIFAPMTGQSRLETGLRGRGSLPERGQKRGRDWA